MRVVIETIPHKNQRYETVGDWEYLPDGTIQIRVSDMGNDDYNYLVALHELIEQKLCAKRGITQKQVDDFDIQFEKDRVEGKHMPDEEPGDHPEAPYQNEHSAASGVERLMSSMLGVKWEDYAVAVESL
jgi:hypothetical protein